MLLRLEQRKVWPTCVLYPAFTVGERRIQDTILCFDILQSRSLSPDVNGLLILHTR
jgi:hypothetical protein